MESGPSWAFSSESLRATRLRASFQLALRNRFSSRMSGVVRRSSLFDMPPAKLSLYAGRNAIRRTMLRRDLKDVTIFGPDVEAASHAAICANRFGFAYAVLPHGLFRFRDLKNCSVARLGFNALDYLDHALEHRLAKLGKEAGVTEHGLFHERIAGTHGDAVTARHAARLSDRGAAVPEHARMWIFPVDGKRFVHLDVLTGFHASPAQDALIGIVSVERIRAVDLVGLGLKRNALMFNGQQLGCVVNSAVSVVVVTNGAIKKVTAEYAIEGLDLRSRGARGPRRYLHPFICSSRARPYELPVHFDHAGVARLNGP